MSEVGLEKEREIKRNKDKERDRKSNKDKRTNFYADREKQYECERFIQYATISDHEWTDLKGERREHYPGAGRDVLLTISFSEPCRSK